MTIQSSIRSRSRAPGQGSGVHGVRRKPPALSYPPPANKKGVPHGLAERPFR
jgi:hypothetical protein